MDKEEDIDDYDSEEASYFDEDEIRDDEEVQSMKQYSRRE